MLIFMIMVIMLMIITVMIVTVIMIIITIKNNTDRYINPLASKIYNRILFLGKAPHK